MISRDSKGLFNLDPLADFYTTNEIKKFYNKTNRQQFANILLYPQSFMTKVTKK